MQRLVSISILGLLIFVGLSAQTYDAIESTYESANAQYNAGNFAQAAQLYEQLLDSADFGDEQAYIYYNLGNAYFRVNELGKSILNYERCLRMQPGNKDARYNLEFAQSKIIDNIDQGNTFFLSQWITTLRNTQTYRIWMWLSIGLFILCLVSLLVFLFTRPIALRKTGFHIAWLAFLFSLCSLALATAAYNHRNDKNEAIVMQGIVNVKSSPDRSGTDLFTLHEGTKVRVSDSVGEWVEIRVGDNIGWLREDNIEYIVH